MVSRWKSVCPSFRLSYDCLSAFSFADNKLSKSNKFSSNFVHLYILGTADLGL